MRIVQIANFYTPTSGGLRTSVDELGRRYRDAGHERVLVVPGREHRDEMTESGRRITVRSPRLVGSGDYHVLTGRRMPALLDTLDPEVLEVSDKVAMTWIARWACRREVPLVLFSHERLDAILRSRVPRGFPLARLADLCNRRLAARADSIVVASEFAGEEFARIGASNVVRIPLGVNLETFRADVPACESRRGPVEIVTVSRLSQEKCVDRAIDALRVLRASGTDAELTILGDGPHRDRLMRRAAELPVHFLGHICEPDLIAKHLAAADVAVFACPVETFGLAVLEALACGTPVVVPAAGATRELIEGTAAGAVTDGTPAGLAAGIGRVLAQPPEQSRRAARSVAQAYPWSATAAALLGLHKARWCHGTT